jgi:hypothetical protein
MLSNVITLSQAGQWHTWPDKKSPPATVAPNAPSVTFVRFGPCGARLASKLQRDSQQGRFFDRQEEKE